MIGVAVTLGLYLVLAGLAIGYYFAARRKCAAGAAHRAAGNLAYDRALWLQANTRHSRYTCADECEQVAGLTAVKCCACNEMVGIVEGEEEITALATRHVREQYQILRNWTNEQVAK